MDSPVDIAGLPPLQHTTDQMKFELVQNSVQAKNLLGFKLEGIEAANAAMSKQQLESMLMNAERSLSNEASNRVLSHMFGKFTLLQKIMQSMG